MRLGTFLVIVGAVGILFGLGGLIAPELMASTYGVMDPTAAQLLSERFLGAELLGVGLISLLSRNLTGASVRPLVTGSLIGNAAGFVVALMAMFNKVMSATGWSTVVIYLVFALGFAYFYFTRKTD